jgi:precorrin-6B methylase 2
MGPRLPQVIWVDKIALALGGNQLVPYVATRKELIPTILELLDLRRGDVFYDLGCGDGRVAIEAVKRYPIKRAVCVEVNPHLAAQAVEKAVLEGVAEKVLVLNTDMRSVGLWDADAIYMYLLTSINDLMRPKLEKELRPGAKIVTLDFHIQGWKPARVIGEPGWQKTLYLYIKE